MPNIRTDITPKLRELVTIRTNNSECVILEVAPGAEMNMMALGVFDGDETFLRLTKGRDVTCTVFRKDRHPSSWHWGAKGNTLVDPNTARQGHLIQSCIETDFGIQCQTY